MRPSNNMVTGTFDFIGKLFINLAVFCASVQADNVACTKLLQAIGFKSVGVMREAFCVDGRLVDRVVFDQLESDLSGSTIPDGFTMHINDSPKICAAFTVGTFSGLATTMPPLSLTE